MKKINRLKGILLTIGAGMLLSMNFSTGSVKAAKTNLGNQNIMSVAWYQTSAEAKALYLQGYNIAKNNLNNDLSESSNKPRAVVLDIDETILDNSPYEAYAALNDKNYPTNWNKWIDSAQAGILPGAKNFLDYANSKGVQIYYVSDRPNKQLKATEKNLDKYNLPQVNNNHVLLQTKGENGKTSRFKNISKNNNILMYFGDSLTDFNNPKSATISSRYQDVQQNKNQFGNKYIVFPNPMYGGWEGSIYNNNYNISDYKKSEERKEQLTYYNPHNNKVEHKTITEPANIN